MSANGMLCQFPILLVDYPNRKKQSCMLLPKHTISFFEPRNIGTHFVHFARDITTQDIRPRRDEHAMILDNPINGIDGNGMVLDDDFIRSRNGHFSFVDLGEFSSGEMFHCWGMHFDRSEKWNHTRNLASLPSIHAASLPLLPPPSRVCFTDSLTLSIAGLSERG